MKIGIAVSVAALIAATASLASAQDAVGTWRCMMVGNIPLGTLTIAPGGDYTLQIAGNAFWEPNPADPGNGSGQLAESEGILIPMSGPLLTEFEVMGEYWSEGERETIFWAAGGAELLQCWPADAAG